MYKNLYIFIKGGIIEMTFDEYIQNPMGRSNAVISNREMYRNMYTMKLDVIMVREMGKIDWFLYKDQKRDAYYAHIKVPSELVEKFYYDVLVEFTPGEDMKAGKDLTNYTAKFYSNDPSFVFTFAHAFIKNGVFINQYKDKMSKLAVQKKAKVKNPMDTVGYVKSLYFAYLIMKRNNLFTKALYMNKYDEKHVKSTIMQADQKVALRQEAGQNLSTKEQRAKASAARARRKQEQEGSGLTSKKVQSSNKIKTTKTVKKVGGSNIKTTKTVGKRNKK